MIFQYLLDILQVLAMNMGVTIMILLLLENVSYCYKDQIFTKYNAMQAY